MKFFAVCEKSIVAFCSAELAKRFEIKPEACENMLFFEAELDKAVEIAYCSQTISDLCMVVFESAVPLDEKPLKLLKKESLKFKKQAKSFSVTSSISKNALCNLNSFQLSNKIGADIERIAGLKLSFRNPDLNFTLAALKNKNLLGLSLFCYDLSKRPYRVFVNKVSVSPPVACAFLIFSGMKSINGIIDPTAKDGTVILEAYHWLSRRPVRKCNQKEFSLSFSLDNDISGTLEDADKKEKEIKGIYAADSSFANLDALRKNAKIAGISKKISLIKSTLDELDLKIMAKDIKKAVFIAAASEKREPASETVNKLLSACSRAGIPEVSFIIQSKENPDWDSSRFRIIQEQAILKDKSSLKFVKAKRNEK
ncbi:MAG TPA: hypothetical protein ENN46_03425 [Candidatus Woesearchaeota archaeon]|nr:hypothetical protein [Candidatus Woesearchaeota archaeon]